MSKITLVREKLTYQQGDGRSFFGDLIKAHALHDEWATARLNRHQREMDVELRDGKPDEYRLNPNSTAGTGGEFDVPLWLIDDDHVKLGARAGRTFGDLVPNEVLPDGVSSVHVPKISTGTLDDVQGAQGDPDTDQDLTSADINQSQVVTLAGESDVSQQLFDLSPTGFDRWAYKDLHLSYNAQLENQLFNGTGINGQLLGLSNFTLAGSNTISGSGAATSTTNGVQVLWPLLGQAFAAVGNNRKLQPEVWLMAPRRWAFITASLDGQNRPIDQPRNPTGSDFGSAGGYPAVGLIDGLPVYLSGAITAGSSADTIYCARPNDMNLFESRERYAIVVNALSGTLQVRLQLRRYVAFVGNAYTTGLALVTALPQPTSPGNF